MSRLRSRWVLLAALLLPVLLVAVANAVVLTRTSDRTTTDPGAVSPAQVAIVPGSRVLPDGTLGDVVAARVDAAVGLYRDGVVDVVLVSGDNRRADYNEPEAMREALLAAGVDPEDVFTDYAGYNTWHTMRRAVEVFEAETAVVVTQEFHLARAVDLGLAAGLDVHGLGVEGSTSRARVREVLARTSGFVQALVRPNVVLGPTHPVTGDGRESWADS